MLVILEDLVVFGVGGVIFLQTLNLRLDIIEHVSDTRRFCDLCLSRLLDLRLKSKPFSACAIRVDGRGSVSESPF